MRHKTRDATLRPTSLIPRLIAPLNDVRRSHKSSAENDQRDLVALFDRWDVRAHLVLRWWGASWPPYVLSTWLRRTFMALVVGVVLAVAVVVVPLAVVVPIVTVTVVLARLAVAPHPRS